MADYEGMSWAELEKLMYGHGKNFDKIAFDRLGNGKAPQRNCVRRLQRPLRMAKVLTSL